MLPGVTWPVSNTIGIVLWLSDSKILVLTTPTPPKAHVSLHWDLRVHRAAPERLGSATLDEDFAEN